MVMKNNIFVTSTGTDIGKTYCFIEIIKELINRKLKVNTFKPILSGFNPRKIEQSDSYKILVTKKKRPNLNDIKNITPWLFEKAIAPSIAALKENRSLCYKEVLNWCIEKIDSADKKTINIFEGAGGVLVPIEGDKTVLDLIKDLDSKVILVVGNYLGSVSHTISAIKNIQQNNIDILNVIVNKKEDNDLSIDDTIYLLKTNFKANIKFRKVFLNDDYKSNSFKVITNDIIDLIN